MAFRSDTPEKWCELLSEDTSALPFLEGAVVRMLEEYPSCFNGLSRTAEQALKVISEGEKSPMKVFAKAQKMEERKFLGDASFWVVLNELLESSPPLIEVSGGEALTLPALEGQELTVTEAGLGVLAGKVNWLDVSRIDRWIGGVHLTSENAWCWDSGTNLLAKTSNKSFVELKSKVNEMLDTVEDSNSLPSWDSLHSEIESSENE